MNVAKRYDDLIRLADDRAGTPEGDTAERIAKRLRDRFPDLTYRPEPTTEVFLVCDGSSDRILLGYAAKYVGGVDVSRVKLGPGQSRRVDPEGYELDLLISGDPGLLEIVEELYLSRRADLARLVEASAHGYAAAAFPMSPDTSSEAPPDALSGRERSALVSGYLAGLDVAETSPRASRPRRRLPGGSSGR